MSEGADAPSYDDFVRTFVADDNIRNRTLKMAKITASKTWTSCNFHLFSKFLLNINQIQPFIYNRENILNDQKRKSIIFCEDLIHVTSSTTHIQLNEIN